MIDCVDQLDCEPALEWSLLFLRDGSRRPPAGPPPGDSMDGNAGDDWTCCRCGLCPGVGGISGAVRGNDSCSKPGVLMLRFVGLLRPVLSGSLNGDDGSERVCATSDPPALLGRTAATGATLRDRFFTFLPRLVAGESAWGDTLVS